MISRVGGCVVEARGLSLMRSSASSKVTSWPKRAQASAATVPTGPAPTTMMRRIKRSLYSGDARSFPVGRETGGAAHRGGRVERARANREVPRAQRGAGAGDQGVDAPRIRVAGSAGAASSALRRAGGRKGHLRY